MGVAKAGHLDRVCLWTDGSSSHVCRARTIFGILVWGQAQTLGKRRDRNPKGLRAYSRSAIPVTCDVWCFFLLGIGVFTISSFGKMTIFPWFWDWLSLKHVLWFHQRSIHLASVQFVTTRRVTWYQRDIKKRNMLCVLQEEVWQQET
jgi:hypothetical protein